MTVEIMPEEGGRTKARKLTVKQKKFVKAYVKHDGNGTKAALAVYDTTSEDVARSMAAENLAKPTIREEIDKALEKHQITMDAAVAPIAEGLKAERISISGQGDQAFAELVPDHSTRLKASSMALKLLGADQQDKAGNTYIFNKGDVVAKKYVKD